MWKRVGFNSVKRDGESIPINNIVCHMPCAAEGDEWGVEGVVSKEK